jgi:MFS family permease
MFANYGAVFRAPGSRAFCAAGFVMRVPIAVYPLAMVLLISLPTHHYGFAGLLSGAYVVGGAPGNPISAALIDRVGQARVIIPSTIIHVASVAALVGLFEGGAPQWTLLAPAALIGFSYVSVSSLVRARWSYVLEGRPELSTAYSLESFLDEIIFILGPLLATILATLIDPIVPIVVAAVFVGTGAVLLARLRETDPPVQVRGVDERRSALQHKGMVLVLLASIAMGALFSSAELSMIAFCGQHGHPGLSGAVLAAFAGGSAISGLLYGTRTWRTSTLTRFRLQNCIFGILPVVFFLATSIGAVAACAFVVGMAIAPALITSFGLIADLVSSRSLTEGLAWLTTGLNLGYGAASTVVGKLADVHGARSGFSVSVAAGVAMAGLAIAVYAVVGSAKPGCQRSASDR